MDVLLLILMGFWLMLPAFLPNSAAVVFGGGTPVDFGRSWKGKRIFGDGKTWRGLIGGISAGIALGFIQIMIASFFDPVNLWGFAPFPQALGVVTALAVGSLLGDLCGSFIKRRLGIERGGKAAGLDQFNFIVGALLLTSLFFPGWIYANFIQGDHWVSLLAVLIITPLLHRSVNIIGYKLGLKKVPW
jgi:CDP-2,3-bis-(O-geranylgeranyl)-sn-glycerol synthase